jgi:hypothetical protein
VLTDYDYFCDDEKRIPKINNKTADFITLPQRLEEELYVFDNSVKTISNFDCGNPCETSKADQPSTIPTIRAFNIVLKAMSNQKTKVKLSKLGQVFDKAVRKAEYYPNAI